MSKSRRNAHDGPVDLASLDPTRRASFDHLVEAIMADVVLGTGESSTPVRAIERARHERVVTAQIVRWRRPALVAAALVFVAAVPSFVLVGGAPAQAASGTAVAATPRFSVADAIGIPRPFADWAGGAGSPSVAEIVAAGDATATASSGPNPRARQGDSTSPTSRFHRTAP
jgi:hypothetical protein